MSDRFNALTVVLAEDLRDDDAAPLIAAIRQLRGVLDVQPHVSDVASVVNRERARHALGAAVMAVLYPELEGADER